MQKTNSVSFGIVVIAIVGVAGLFAVDRADARSDYKKVFQAKYPDVIKAQKDGKITCNVCHEGKSKKKRNIYGVALSKLVGKKQKDKKKIDAALTKVESEKSAIEGQTFGDLLKAKKLPASKE